MVNSRNKLEKNIKHLRAAFGETQLELALAIGLNSPNAIANYEKGIRTPKSDIIKKIAAHYRITENELIDLDLSELYIDNLIFNNLDNLMFNNIENLVKMMLLMLPIVKTEEAMGNDPFNRALELHIGMLVSFKNDEDYINCYKSYSDAFYNSGVHEALVNLTSLLLLKEIRNKNVWTLKVIKEFEEKEISSDDLLKKLYLRDCDIENEGEKSQEKIILEESLQDDINNKLKDLKKITMYSNLADYYSALRYIMGCVRNKFSDDMNKMIGEEMMLSFWKLGNEYVEKLGSFIIENIEK